MLCLFVEPKVLLNVGSGFSEHVSNKVQARFFWPRLGLVLPQTHPSVWVKAKQKRFCCFVNIPVRSTPSCPSFEAPNGWSQSRCCTAMFTYHELDISKCFILLHSTLEYFNQLEWSTLKTILISISFRRYHQTVKLQWHCHTDYASWGA